MGSLRVSVSYLSFMAFFCVIVLVCSFFVVFVSFCFDFMLLLELLDVPLIFSCSADYVPGWQRCIVLCMVEARSVNRKNTHIHTRTRQISRRIPRIFQDHSFYQYNIPEHRDDFTQEADFVRWIYGARGGYETTEVRDVRSLGGGRGRCGGSGKRGMGVCLMTSELSALTPTSERLQPRTRGNGVGRWSKG